MIRESFSLSGNQEEEQKRRLDEENRVKNIEKIKDPIERRKANAMMNNRDYLLDQLKTQADIKIEQAVQEEIRKKAAHKMELHIKPPRGMSGATPNEREGHIRTQVNNNLGKKLAEGIREVENSENRKIDEFSKNTLENEREKSAERKSEFEQNSNDVTQKKETHSDKEKLRAKMEERASRGRGRSRGGRSRQRGD